MSVARLSLVALLAAACARTETAADPLPDLQRWVSGAEGFDTTSWWLDTGSEVVVFDAQFTPALAEALIADIEARTDSPITTLVVTHPNPDKFNGATAFQAIGAEVIASAATALAMPGVHAYKEAYFTSVGAFEPGAYPALPEVDRTFGDRLALDLDGAAVELLVLDAPGVTTTQTVALVGDGPAALVVGDLTAGRAHGWLEGGIVDGVATPDLAGWHDALDELLALGGDGAAVYPGRGEALPVAVAVDEMHAWLDSLEQITADVVGAQADPATALSGDEAGAIYGEITARAEAAWPDWGLSYLVTYGVYGLAWQIAER